MLQEIANKLESKTEKIIIDKEATKISFFLKENQNVKKFIISVIKLSESLNVSYAIYNNVEIENKKETKEIIVTKIIFYLD